MNGYNGEVLFVDLTSGTIEKESLPEKTYRDFIGGQGLGIKILYEPPLDGSGYYIGRAMFVGDLFS